MTAPKPPVPSEKRYGAREEKCSFTPADPGKTLEELLELFDRPDELVNQLARDLIASRARLAELEAEMAELRDRLKAETDAVEHHERVLRSLPRRTPELAERLKQLLSNIRGDGWLFADDERQVTLVLDLVLGKEFP